MTENDNTEFLPCPFCGGDGIWFTDSINQIFSHKLSGTVSCETKDCPRRSGAFYSTREIALKAWNKRVATECDTKQKEL